jgi:hypothetical protein
MRGTRRRQRGGAVDCDSIGFTDEIMQASLGRNYPELVKKYPGDPLRTLHDRGQMIDFETLASYGKYGIMEWYARKAGIPAEDWDRLTNLYEVKILMAFFNRMKIVLENINILFNVLTTSDDIISFIVIPRSVDAMRRKVKNFEGFKSHMNKMKLDIDYETLNEIYSAKDRYLMYILQLDKIINKIQCIMWYVMKFKKLPDDFSMYKSIEDFAKTPIFIEKLLDVLNDNLKIRSATIIAWAKKAKELAEIFEDAGDGGAGAGARRRSRRRHRA